MGHVQSDLYRHVIINVLVKMLIDKSQLLSVPIMSRE